MAHLIHRGHDLLNEAATWQNNLVGGNDAGSNAGQSQSSEDFEGAPFSSQASMVYEDDAVQYLIRKVAFVRQSKFHTSDHLFR